MSVYDMSKIPVGGTGNPSPTVIDVPLSGQRSLATITAEIRAYQDAARRMAITYCIEVGRRLVEAKSMVSHGEWGSYLREELGFSQSRANDLMRIFEAYAADQMRLDGDNLKNQAFGNLTYTQALALLALPSEEEREAFVEEHDMTQISTRQLQEELRRRGEDGGTDSSTPLRSAQNDSKGEDGGRPMTAPTEEPGREAELEKALNVMAGLRKEDAARIQEIQEQASAANLARDEALKAQDAAQKASAEAERKAQEAAEALAKAQKELAEARKAEKKALKALNEAKADKSVPPETLEKLRQEAQKAAEASHKADYEALEEARKKYSQAEQEASAARQEAEKMADTVRRYAKEKEALEKQLRLAAPEMAVFKASFERVQVELSALIDSVAKLPEDKQAGAWKALAALLGQIGRIVEAHTGGTVETDSSPRSE